MGFFRQEYWSGLPFPSPGDLPNPGIESASPVSPALQADSNFIKNWSLQGINSITGVRNFGQLWVASHKALYVSLFPISQPFLFFILTNSPVECLWGRSHLFNWFSKQIVTCQSGGLCMNGNTRIYSYTLHSCTYSPNSHAGIWEPEALSSKV